MHPTQQTADSMIGQVINGLRIESVLDEDGMGAVFLARQATLNMQRALKVIRTDYQESRNLQQRFHRDATALKDFNHPKVARVVDFGRLQNGWLYLCTEYIEGPSLATIVKDNGPMPVERSLLVLSQITDALAAAHERNIAHGALCPDNVILDGCDLGRLKVFDFGLAELLSDEKLSSLTETQRLLGSHSYRAPEQAEAGVAGPAADVYALAGIAYFLLTGSPVFPADVQQSRVDAALTHRHQPPVGLSQRCQLPLPSMLEKLLMACLAKAPYDRPTAEELAGHFRRLHSEAILLVTPLNAEDTLKETPREEVSAQAQPDCSVAELLWTDTDNELLRAIENQITAVTLDLGREVARHQGLGSALGSMLTEYERSHEALGHLELEHVLLEAQLGSANADIAAKLQMQYQAFGRRILGLKAGSSHLLRRVFEVSMRAAARIDAQDVQALQAELDVLIARFHREFSKTLA